jgi:hypothetical protein
VLSLQRRARYIVAQRRHLACFFVDKALLLHTTNMMLAIQMANYCFATMMMMTSLVTSVLVSCWSLYAGAGLAVLKAACFVSMLQHAVRHHTVSLWRSVPPGCWACVHPGPLAPSYCLSCEHCLIDDFATLIKLHLDRCVPVTLRIAPRLPGCVSHPDGTLTALFHSTGRRCSQRTDLSGVLRR